MADEKTTPEVLKPYAQEWPATVQAGITSGDITLADQTVTAKIDKLQKDGKINKVDFSKSYKKLVATSPHGALILADLRKDDEAKETNDKALLRLVTDAYDAGVRSNVRAAIVTEATGPEATIKSMAAKLAKIFGISEEAALAQVRNMEVIKANLGEVTAAPTETQTEQPAEQTA